MVKMLLTYTEWPDLKCGQGSVDEMTILMMGR